MSAFAEALRGPRPLLLDGGFGTMLIARGLPPGRPPEEWVLERPTEVSAVHRAYVEAGSEAVHAATFGANPVRLSRHGIEEHLEKINAAAIRLARVSGARFVLADIGPTGEYLPPVGQGDVARWQEAFQRQARALRDCGADAFHLETFSDVREARVALDALRSAGISAPILASLTFNRTGRGYFTVMGDPLVRSLRALADAGADAVGANCTITSAEMGELAAEARHAGLTLVLQPNAGQPRLDGGAVRYEQEPERFALEMAALCSPGAGAGGGRVAAVGGCCGTDPRFIAALRDALRRSEHREA